MNIPSKASEITPEFIEFATMEMKETAVAQVNSNNERRTEKLAKGGVVFDNLGLMHMRFGLLVAELLSPEQILDLELKFQRVFGVQVLEEAEKNLIRHTLLQGVNGHGVPPLS